MKLFPNREKIKLLEELIRNKISAGDLSPGEKIMSETQISKLLGMDKREIRSALRNLKKEKLIVSFGGKGTYVLQERSSQHQKKLIGVIHTGGVGMSAGRALRGIESILASNGYEVIYRNTGNSQIKEEKILKSMISDKYAGYIIEPSKSQLMCGHMYIYNRLDELNIPYVFISGSYPQMIDKPKVIVDDSQGGYMLTRHMIASVGDNIVGVFRADDVRGFERHRGYVKALQEASIPYRPELVIWYNVEEKLKRPTMALERILNTRVCDGIICYDDDMAKNVIYYLFQNGYSVPDDIAVAGYGNFAIANVGELGLTTIAQPEELMGEIAAEYIIELIMGENGAAQTAEKILNPELVIRGSTTGA